MSGGFRRSAVFGIGGVFVVAALCILIASSVDSRDASPKAQYALIFGVVAVYLVILFALQRADLRRAAGADALRSGGGPREIENPTTMDEPELWAALAVKPIDAEAVRARGDAWGAARRSQGGAMLVTLLIMLTVPPIYLLDSFVPLLIGGPIIAIVVVFLAIRAIGPGGEVDSAYERMNVSMAPLGLGVNERPQVRLEPAIRPSPGTRRGCADARPRGHPARAPGGGAALGRRRGEGETRVGERVAEFEVKARDGRLRAAKSAPAKLREAFESVPASTRWKGVKVVGGADGIAVERSKSGSGDWMCDLWLAERLAERLG